MSIWAKIIGRKSGHAEGFAGHGLKENYPGAGPSGDVGGRDPLDSNCRECHKPLGPGGMRGSVVMSGGDLFKMMEEHAVYACKSCGAPFCMECMVKLKIKPCPVCKMVLGW